MDKWEVIEKIYGKEIEKLQDRLTAVEKERDEWKDAYYKVKKERDIAEAALREAVKEG